MRVLFVCTGNSCRSPMAELYFNAEMCRRGRFDMEALSAGLCASPGCPVSAPAFQVMRSIGIDGGTFRSRALSRELVSGSDLIVVMSRTHAESLRRACPEAADKIQLLLDECGGGDVPDPFGGSVARYFEVFGIMRPALDQLAEKLLKQCESNTRSY